MRFKLKPKKKKDRYSWHLWFAWWPVKIDEECVLFEKVYRKKTCVYMPPEVYYEYWEYKNIGDESL
jgi:hypothetical protein